MTFVVWSTVSSGMRGGNGKVAGNCAQGAVGGGDDRPDPFAIATRSARARRRRPVLDLAVYYDGKKVASRKLPKPTPRIVLQRRPRARVSAGLRTGKPMRAETRKSTR